MWERIEPPEPKKFLVGVDLGQARDPSAVIVAEQSEPQGGAVYDIGHVERLPLETRYPAVVRHIGSVVGSLLAIRPRATVVLVVDRTGVGRAVGDLITRETVGVDPVLVTITAGDTVNRADDGGWRVPKRELSSIVQSILQTGRFRFAGDEPLLDSLKTELAGFRAKIRITGGVSFEAGDDWRSAPHDDLVLALALIAWAGETGIGMGRFEAATPEIVALLQPLGL